MANKPRREMSPRRTAKSVRSHEKTMQALGEASGWKSMTAKFSFGNTRAAYSPGNEKWPEGYQEAFTPGNGGVYTGEASAGKLGIAKTKAKENN